MAIGQYNPRQRYRERSVRRVNAAILFLLAIGSMSVIAFWMGRQYAALQLDSLKKQVEESNTQLASLQEEVVKVRAEAQTATSRP
jgi:cell division protein FtsB